MRKTIYIKPEHKGILALWQRAIKVGLIPGKNQSNRFAKLVRQDVQDNAHKLRRAGISVAALKEAE
jgi:hypothetical protein